MTSANTTYDENVWAAIKREWLSGQLNLSDISRTFGPSRAAIHKRAKADDWPAKGSLIDVVRKEIHTRLLDDDEVTAEVTPGEASDIVQSAAKRGVEVVRRHRDFIRRIFGALDVTLDELENMNVISQELLNKRRSKARAALVTSLSKAKLDSLRASSQVLTQVIPLERQAYSLDDDKGQALPIKYVAPDYDKPMNSGLAEEDWQDEQA